MRPGKTSAPTVGFSTFSCFLVWKTSDIFFLQNTRVFMLFRLFHEKLENPSVLRKKKVRRFQTRKSHQTDFLRTRDDGTYPRPHYITYFLCDPAKPQLPRLVFRLFLVWKTSDFFLLQNTRVFLLFRLFLEKQENPSVLQKKSQTFFRQEKVEKLTVGAEVLHDRIVK